MILARAQNAESNHLEALKARHADISRELDEEKKHPAASDIDLRKLKLKKLKIKDEMEGIRQTS